MASPYGHALVGLGLLNLCCPRWVSGRWKSILVYGLVVFGACSPDLDFLPGLLVGNLSRFHHGPFHSLGMAIALSLSTGILIAFWGKPPSLFRITGFVFILIFSHLVLDFFTEDLKPPFGFPLFWPFSRTYYLSSWPVLPYVDRGFSNPAIWSQIIRIFIVENLFFLPFFFLSRKLRGDGAENLLK
jgi:inner membrane protein